MKGRKAWKTEQGRRAVQAFSGGIPLYDRYGRLKSTRTDICCPKCLHWAYVVVPAGRQPKFRCSKCGTLTTAHDDDD